MGPASLYGTLKKLAGQGLVEEVPPPSGDSNERGRRYYRLTGLGARVCQAEVDRLAQLIKLARTTFRPGLA